MRLKEHPVLGTMPARKTVRITVDGIPYDALAGEPIAAALWAAGIKTFRHTRKRGGTRGYFCGLGRCTDCVMRVDGADNVRTCVTPVRTGMVIETQIGLGTWRKKK